MTSPLSHTAPEPAVEGHPVWSEVAPELTPKDFRFPFLMDVAFLRLLSRTRRRAGVPFRVVSDHRPPDRNDAVGGAKGSAHMGCPCRAVDLHVKSNFERAQILAAAFAEGIARVGVYPAAVNGAGSLHLDASHTHPSPRVWTRY